MGASGSKQAPVIPPAPVAPEATTPAVAPIVPAPAPVAAQIPMAAEPLYPEEEEEEEELEEVPTISDVIAKLKEAKDMLYQIADAEEKQPAPVMEQNDKGYVGGKKKLKGGFLDAQRAILNTSDLMKPADGYTRFFVPDPLTMPQNSFSGSSMTNDQMPPILPNNVYMGLMPPMGISGGAAAKKKRTKAAKKA